MPVQLKRAVRAIAIVLALALAAGAARWQPALAHPIAAPRADTITHTVQAGENLYRIGLKYGVSWIDIMQANGLPNSTIYVGQQLLIPLNGPAPTPPPEGEPAPTATAPPAGTSSTYIVQRGDILSRIAQAYGVTVSAIVQANNIPNPSLIYAGQVLIIPAPGDTSGGSPAPFPSGGNKEIRVDISEQRMYVYQDGGLLWNWVVSTGEPGRDTRPGNYSVLNKIPNAYGSTWDLWMPNWLGITWTTLCFEAKCLANEPYTGHASLRLGNGMPLAA